MQIPLISDVDQSIAKSYGCLIKDGPNAGVSLRATFIIDKKGILRQFSVNDLQVGREVKEVLRLVQAFQHFDEHGEVCPASWKPGDASMHNDWDSKNTQEYFEAQEN